MSASYDKLSTILKARRHNCTVVLYMYSYIVSFHRLISKVSKYSLLGPLCYINLFILECETSIINHFRRLITDRNLSFLNAFRPFRGVGEKLL